MPKKDSHNTKNKIISAAWSLFYKYGFERTTVEDIIFLSSTSRGSFYHYFGGKDDLLNTLSDLFDSRYEQLSEKLTDDMSAFEKLMFLNREQFAMVENSVPMDLLARMYSSQLTSSGSRNLLDHNRVYYKMLRQIVIEGKEKGEFIPGASVNEIVRAYAMCERALISDWCLSNGEYSLCREGEVMLPRLFRGFINK
ncbi:MAG: TetR/AcrR family transcriptional regulator [Clostridia bacterium]|nr:TetR/AcrR family transcriptional regulator [Clostridia bacterium]MBR6335253.1 TetR/AcrR family transcriptional regulator [Clostridia bacterium]